MVRDLHYTPTLLAEHLISFIEKKNISSVADFCVGEGELLLAAKRKWPKAILCGCDISEKTIISMKRAYPFWMLSKCDFLNPKSRNSSIVLKNKYDLVLLNPPFTCKGSTIKKVFFEGQEFHMSTSMAFFVESIQYLNDEGVMYAILPQSIAYSKKDEKIRLYLIEKYNFRILEERNNQEFEKCAPNIILASINEKNVFPMSNTAKRLNIKFNGLRIQRGSISMNEINEKNSPFVYLIHSTNIRDNKIVDLKYKVDPIRSRIDGPALLIHRVGQPNEKKICIINKGEAYALSDCIIGIKTFTLKDCISLKKIILENWDDFSNMYKGTGAKYITIDRIKSFLSI